MAFKKVIRVPVAPPYRLDLTADALRRLAANVVDVLDSDGTYYRAMHARDGAALVVVRQRGDAELEIQTTAKQPATIVASVERMLGTRADLGDWRRRAATIEWLAPLAAALDGVRPPRYETLWEACAHAVVFQQISIHAAAAIMRRLVVSLGEPVVTQGRTCVAFPTPAALQRAPEETLREAGLSENKRRHLRSIADEIANGSLDEQTIDSLPTPEAAAYLTRARGIGPWSAAVVLLRGFGRLDTFPMNDSGVARSVKLLAGGGAVDLDAVLEALGPTRGMLYYHLLLGRMRNLVPGPGDSKEIP